MAINIVNIVKGGQWRDRIAKYWPLAIYGALGSGVGSRLLILVDPAPFQLLLAGVILLYLYQYRIGMNLQWINSRPQVAYAAYGLVGGFLAGTVNVMVPVLIIFALEMGLAPKAMVQIFNFCFFFGKLSQTLVFANAGMINSHILLLSVPVVVISLMALGVGIVLRDKVDTQTYRRWLRVVLWILTGVLVGKFVLSLAG
jgi:uncharacterized membrane protein YfcA